MSGRGGGRTQQSWSVHSHSASRGTDPKTTSPGRGFCLHKRLENTRKTCSDREPRCLGRVVREGGATEGVREPGGEGKDVTPVLTVVTVSWGHTHGSHVGTILPLELSHPWSRCWHSQTEATAMMPNISRCTGQPPPAPNNSELRRLPPSRG